MYVLHLRLRDDSINRRAAFPTGQPQKVLAGRLRKRYCHGPPDAARFTAVALEMFSLFGFTINHASGQISLPWKGKPLNLNVPPDGKRSAVIAIVKKLNLRIFYKLSKCQGEVWGTDLNRERRRAMAFGFSKSSLMTFPQMYGKWCWMRGPRSKSSALVLRLNGKLPPVKRSPTWRVGSRDSGLLAKSFFRGSYGVSLPRVRPEWDRMQKLSNSQYVVHGCFAGRQVARRVGLVTTDNGVGGILRLSAGGPPRLISPDSGSWVSRWYVLGLGSAVSRGAGPMSFAVAAGQDVTTPSPAGRSFRGRNRSPAGGTTDRCPEGRTRSGSRHFYYGVCARNTNTNPRNLL